MLFCDHSSKYYHAEYHFANIIESSVAMLILIEQYAVTQSVAMPSVIFQAVVAPFMSWSTIYMSFY